MRLSNTQRRVLEAIPLTGKTYALDIINRTSLLSSQVLTALRMLYWYDLIDREQAKSERGGPAPVRHLAHRRRKKNKKKQKNEISPLTY